MTLHTLRAFCSTKMLLSSNPPPRPRPPPPSVLLWATGFTFLFALKNGKKCELKQCWNSISPQKAWCSSRNRAVTDAEEAAEKTLLHCAENVSWCNHCRNQSAASSTSKQQLQVTHCSHSRCFHCPLIGSLLH